MIASTTNVVRRRPRVVEPERKPPLPIEIRALRQADLGYARHSFAESHKDAPGVASMSWRTYKRFIVPELNSVLVHPTTELLGAYLGPVVVGWIALARGKRVNTVHWLFTRYAIAARPDEAPSPWEGTECRRRHVASMLVDAAGLGERLVYTFKGAHPKHRSDGITMDERLVPWLRGRGQHAAYVPWEEWSR